MIIRVSNHADRIRLTAIKYEGRFRKRRRPSLFVENFPVSSPMLWPASLSAVHPRDHLLCFAPDDVFVVPAIDESIDLSVIGVAKQNATLHALTEKDIRSLGQELLAFAFSLDIQLFALGGNDSGLSGCQLVGANKVRKLFWVALADCGIFVIAHGLSGHDLPRAVTSQPSVSAVITSSEILAENRFGLIEIVTQDRGVPMDDALHFSDLDRARIAAWQWCDVGNQRGLVQGASFFIGKDAIISEIFFPWLCVAWDNGIEQLLGAANKFILRNRIVCHGGSRGNNPKHDERYGERKGSDVHVRE